MTFSFLNNMNVGRKVGLNLILGLSYIALTACATVGSNERDSFLGNEDNFLEEFPAVDAYQVAQTNVNDTFKVGDTADITVYQVESLTGAYVVDRAGNINFPLIGTVGVAGLSTLDLQQTLTRSYGETYIQNPSINVRLEAIELGSIVVDGSVEKPGVFELSQIIKLSEAIALAQGIGEDSSGAKVYIIRNVEGERKVGQVDLRKVRNLTAVDPDIIPGDVVFVEDSVGRVVFREFLRTVPLINTALIYTVR